MVVPTPRLWALLCLLSIPAMVAGFVAGVWPFVLVLDGIIVGCALMDVLLARDLDIKVRRELPTRLSVGVANRVELHVLNRSARPVLLELKDDAPEEFTIDSETLPLTIPANSRANLTYRATPQKRGKFNFGDLTVRIRGPLGFVRWERVFPAATQASVYPDLRGASRLLLSGAALDLVNLGLRQLRRDGRGSEFARLRDYAQGDSVREVDWKATARRGRPVTRVMESERSQSVL